MLEIMKIVAVAKLLRNDNENRDTRYQTRDTNSGRRVTEIFLDYDGICPPFWIAARRMYNE